MYPYTKEIDLGQAISLKEISKTKAEGFLVYCDHSDGIHNIEDVDFNYIYSQVKGKFFCDALTYATHILKQKTPPEGYGYANKELKQGTYTGLPWAFYTNGNWTIINDSDDSCYIDSNQSVDTWNVIAFRLTDLARVEGTDTNKVTVSGTITQFENADTDKTEINAAQVAYMANGIPITINGKEIYNPAKFSQGNTLNLTVNPETKQFEISTSDYNSLPQEFKDLAAPIPPSGIRPPLNCCPKCDETHQELTAKVANWEAKYKELERATTSTLNTSHGQRSFSDYVNGYCKQLDLADRVAELEAKNKELKETKDPFEEQFEQIAANQKLNRLHSKIEWQNQIIEKYSELIELYKQQGR